MAKNLSNCQGEFQTIQASFINFSLPYMSIYECGFMVRW